jgi:hypothetical protein
MILLKPDLSIMEINTLSFEDIQPYLHSLLSLCFTPSITLDAEVIEIEKLPMHSEHSSQPFSIVFQTNQLNEYFPQATYVLIHPTKGKTPIFLVPLGPDQKGMKYQAIFN